MIAEVRLRLPNTKLLRKCGESACLPAKDPSYVFCLIAYHGLLKIGKKKQSRPFLNSKDDILELLI